MHSFSIHQDTTLGHVRLIVADLSRAIGFYTDVLGLQLLSESGQSVQLGTDTGKALVVLSEKPDAPPRLSHTTGLYHFAILVPGRQDLALALQRITDWGYPLQGASDHLVSEALYLSDPEGNGIEIYADRPRDKWQWSDGQLTLATVPLDLNELLKELTMDTEPRRGMVAGTRIGHIHLHVADLEETESFYRRTLGFDLVARYGPSAAFVSAGGYHHHIGLNTWAGVGAAAPPLHALGLDHFTLKLPNEAAIHALQNHLYASQIPFTAEHDGVSLRDPANNGLFLTA